MENLILLDNLKQKNSLNIDIDKKVDFVEDRNRSEFTNVVSKVIDSGTNYIIKALPVNDSIKDIALDVKEAFKTKDFSQIIRTAVNSTIREGLEFLNLPKNVISDIKNVAQIAFRGGLSTALTSGIDIIANKYLKNNLFSPILGTVLNDVKRFIGSKDFRNKIDEGVNKLTNKTEQFNELCEKWYNAYASFDVITMNSICRNIKKIEPHVVNDKDCVIQTSIIENMTKLINAKQDKLSDIQMKICSNI